MRTSLISFVLLAIAVVGTSQAAANDVTCKLRFSGTLSLTSPDATSAAQVITLDYNKIDSLTTDFAHAGNPGVDDVQFVFSECHVSGTHEWNKGVATVGQLQVFTSGKTFITPWNGGCVTAGPSANLGRHALSVQACASSTDDDRLASQWFVANDFRAQNGDKGYVTVALRGGPDGKLDIANADEGQYEKRKPAVSMRKAGKQVLALIDAKDVLQ